MARCFYLARQTEQGDEIVSNLLQRSEEWISWIETITPSRRNGSFQSWYLWMQTMERALAMAEQFDRSKIHHQYINQYELHIKHGTF